MIVSTFFAACHSRGAQRNRESKKAIRSLAFFASDWRRGLWPARSDGWLNSALCSLAVAAFCSTSAFAIDFKPYGRGAFAQIVKAHAGRPAIIHFWSIACPPCIAELPQWAKMIAERKDVDVVFVNVDREEERARAEARAEKAGLGKATHYGFSDDFVERLYFEADVSWRGELPFTTLVTPSGGMTAVTGAIDDPLVTKWLETRK